MNIDNKKEMKIVLTHFQFRFVEKVNTGNVSNLDVSVDVAAGG